MVMPGHICPYGLKARFLLRRKGLAVDDHWLRTREETDEFKARHGVESTPQVFIDGRRIGGYEALRRHFGLHVKEEGETTYRPVVAVFAVALLMAAAMRWAAGLPLVSAELVASFVAASMCLLAMLKLQDLESFSTMFLNYDLLARRAVPYAYAYPFGELLAGVLMLSGQGLWLVVPVAAFIGTVGAVSVFQAVYVEKRALRCACVGGGSQVPLGFVSLTENLMMVGMAVWMGLRLAGTL
ncbi:glutaredoxin family protein [Paracidovorax sp. MALMAid1276]|uniref:glutaredoxin family protein n=1 Tax=Paracidovorax sp. MALMAid1276 TaxID=3411631 RepID=UPI003B9B3F7A